MSDGVSPLMLRRRLRTELRTARLAKELTQEQVAKAMDWSLSKMNRIEKAKSSISINDLRVLLPVYGIVDKERTDELVAMARGARRPGWWSGYKDVASPELITLIEYESAASSISQFETMFVPGILQTKEYAEAVLWVFRGDESSPEAVASLVDLRTNKRNMPAGENSAERFFILDESVIHRLVGSPSIMSRQLEHLVSVAELPNVTIQIVPFAAGQHPGMKGSFEVVHFDDTTDEDIVFFEGLSDDSIREDAKEAEKYLNAFRYIAAKSLGPSESVSLLKASSRFHDRRQTLNVSSQLGRLLA